jgi:hypothetical protein
LELGLFESTLDRPVSSELLTEGFSDEASHLIGIDAHIIPVLREYEYEFRAIEFEPCGLEIYYDSSLSLECVEEGNIGKLWSCLCYLVLGI